MRFSKVTLESIHYMILMGFSCARKILFISREVYLPSISNQYLVVPSIFALNQGSCFHDQKLPFGYTFSRFVLNIAQLSSLIMLIYLHQQCADRLA